MFKVGDKVRLTEQALQVSHRLRRPKIYDKIHTIVRIKNNCMIWFENDMGYFTPNELRLAQTDFQAFINCIESSIMDNGETTT